MLNEDFKYDVSGAPVIYSDLKPTPHNPLNRPKISYRKPVLAALIYLAVSCVISIASAYFFHDLRTVLFILAFWSLACFFIIGKRAVIWLVHLYQNKAPDKVRLRCVFEPSCSEYMIIALEKYGLIRGLCKGIFRLFRCHLPNGGTDYP